MKQLKRDSSPKMKMLSLFTNPQAVSKLYEFLSSVEHKLDILKNVGSH